jgi:NADPH-dependent 7-cyano-7-deazaguanine reductase QueF-like protein
LDSGSLAENKKFLIASKSFGLTLSSKNQLELDKIYLLDGVFEEEGKISVLLKSSPLEIKE